MIYKNQMLWEFQEQERIKYKEREKEAMKKKL